jgi:hypothetical protein
MIGMVFLILAGFALMVWRSYRVEAKRARQGLGYQAEGKLRWTPPSSANS